MTDVSKVLLVDDEVAHLKTLERLFQKEGYDVFAAEGGQQALDIVREEPINLVITDLMMPDVDGMDLLKLVRTLKPECEVILMTAFGTVERAVQGMKEGAYDFITKPIKRQTIVKSARQALERQALVAENRALKARLEELTNQQSIVGQSPPLREALDLVRQVAASDVTVLLTGESGTGKELFARMVYEEGDRANKPFVAVNCAALPESILESELFGYEKGAFTGANQRKIGRFDAADGGTIFLDEIGEMSPKVQVKLLRVLQDGVFERLGSNESTRVDVRLIAATNRELADEVRAGRFREDLYYRLNVIRIQVPPLRDRRADIPLLVGHFVRKYAEREDRPPPEIDPRCMSRLQAYDWPGNVRQLEHAVERALILSKSDPLWVDPPEDRSLSPQAAPTPTAPASAPSRVRGESLDDAIAKYEREIIIAALKENEGVQARAARQLGVSRSRLNYRIQKLDIQVSSIEYE